MSMAERIAQRLHCLGCGRRYQHRDLQLVGVGSGELDLYIHCTACGLYLQLTVAEQDDVVSVVASTLPKPAQVEQVVDGATPITDEDVAAIRQFLSSFEGDMHRLLGPGDEGSW